MDLLDRSAGIQERIARLKRDKASREVDRTEASLRALTLSAPSDGLVLIGLDRQSERKWQEGDSAWPGQVLAEIPDLSALEVEAWLSDVDYGQVRAGMAARCRPDSDPARVFEGRVEQVGEVASGREAFTGRRFFPVRVALVGGDPEAMRPGMSVQVEVVRGRWEGAILVPRASLKRTGSGSSLTLPGGRTVGVDIAGCNAVECALRGEPALGSLAGGAP
jgi:multidrug efflux pump subunit AcrA (membrane-fusion protein)